MKNSVEMWEYIDKLKQQLEDLQEKYAAMNSERLTYIKLWEAVPVEQRMEIHRVIPTNPAQAITD